MRHTTLLFLLLAGALSIALFSVKYQVQDLEQELVDLNKSIIKERQSVHVLKAEWSYLNNPQRLGDLAERHLGMKPADPSRMTSFRDFDNQLMSARSEDENKPDPAISKVSGEGRKSQ